MKRLLVSLTLMLASVPLLSQTGDLLTFYEKSGRQETPRYAETIEYCRLLDKSSPMITYTTFGRSPQGRDLPLLILDREGLHDPASIRKAGRIVIMVLACIHAGEPDGKDAGLMLLRDLSQKHDLKTLLEHVSVIFIPIFNVDGHERFGPYNRINQNGPREMGWRTTATNLNLNRDFLKAETPEMLAWLSLFNEWMPDFFFDCHTTDGADYQYSLTYAMEVYGGMDAGLTSWAKQTFIPSLTSRLDSAGFLTFPYVSFRNWHDPRSGLISEASPPMLSQGYVAQRNRPGLLIETHMLKPYHQRVSATYACILTSLSLLDKNYQKIRDLNDRADAFTQSDTFVATPFPLRFETLMTDSTIVDFKGVEYQVIHSDLTGGNWFRYGSKPVVFRIPYFNKTHAVQSATLPFAYIIPAEWSGAISKLAAHGIIMHTIKRDTTVLISTYRFRSPKWQQTSYEGHHIMSNIECDELSEQRSMPAGSVVVEVKQQAGRIIPHLLEPQGNGSLVFWGYFDAVMEQKEYGESYVIEKMAREMLAGDPSIRKEFEQKMASDSLFARTPQMILNWFYNNSEYSDTRKGIYPVGKIYNKEAVEGLITD